MSKDRRSRETFCFPAAAAVDLGGQPVEPKEIDDDFARVSLNLNPENTAETG